MPEIPEMLVELMGMVKDEEISNDACQHLSPTDIQEFCNVLPVHGSEYVNVAR